MVEELLDYVVEIDGREIRLEGVPTQVCDTCDHTEVEAEVVAAIEDMLDHLDTVQEGTGED